MHAAAPLGAAATPVYLLGRALAYVNGKRGCQDTEGTYGPARLCHVSQQRPPGTNRRALLGVPPGADTEPLRTEPGGSRQRLGATRPVPFTSWTLELYLSGIIPA